MQIASEAEAEAEARQRQRQRQKAAAPKLSWTAAGMHVEPLPRLLSVSIPSPRGILEILWRRIRLRTGRGGGGEASGGRGERREKMPEGAISKRGRKMASVCLPEGDFFFLIRPIR